MLLSENKIISVMCYFIAACVIIVYYVVGGFLLIVDGIEDLGKPQLQLGFMCFLVDQKTDEHFVVSVSRLIVFSFNYIYSSGRVY